MKLSDRQRRLLAVAYGLLCHGTFLVAIACMAVGLYTGLESGLGQLTGTARLFANGLLVVQFPLVHSFLLSGDGRRLLSKAAPRGLGRTLSPTTFAWVASLQLLATFLLWSPSGVELGRPEGLAYDLNLACFLGAWLFLGKALMDAGLGLQTGWIGWTAAWRGDAPRYPGLPDRGLFSRCRQPIYLGFALTLLTGPVWTPDRLALAIVWGVYCGVGPLHKERRFAALHGDAFRAYQARVPYILPRLF